METLFTMSHSELNRVDVMKRISEKRLRHAQAAELLNISIRQSKRLYAAYKAQGPTALISKHRNKIGNRRLSDDFKEHVIGLICTHYIDFGPTLACEKLMEIHKIKLCVETVRRLMIQAGFWKTRAQKLKRAYQPRYRRACYGELVQIDGSDHDWFEGRAPKCTLLVYIDDATSELMHLKFVPEESTFSYFAATKDYLLKHGKLMTFYSDKYSVFRVN